MDNKDSNWDSIQPTKIKRVETGINNFFIETEEGIKIYLSKKQFNLKVKANSGIPSTYKTGCQSCSQTSWKPSKLNPKS